MMAFSTLILPFEGMGTDSADILERQHSKGILLAARDDTTVALFLGGFIIASSKIA